MASWLADRVGDSGSVLAVDRNTALLQDLSTRSTVEIVESSLEDADFAPRSLDLIHTRNVLMHIDDADGVIAKLVEALRGGGRLPVEEADYYSLAGATSEAFTKVMAPLVGRWTWARTIPTTMLHGGSAEAAFWTHTLRSAENRLVDSNSAVEGGGGLVNRASFDQVMRLLADATFWTPFATVVCVSCQRV